MTNQSNVTENSLPSAADGVSQNNAEPTAPALRRVPRITIVIPALNEAAGIVDVIGNVPVEDFKNMGYETEILVVDGGSTDGTVDLATKAGARVVVDLRRGYGRAMMTGFEQARGDIMVTADGDRTYPVERAHELVRHLIVNNLDFLTTNRFPLMTRGSMSFRNKVGNKVLSLVTWALYGVPIKDVESGMWVARKDILPKMVLRSDSWPFSHEFKIEAVRAAHARWQEVNIEYRTRAGAVRMEGWRVGVQDLVHLISKRLKWRNEHRSRV